MFDGSGSSDADDDPLIYLWDFGGGSVGSGVNPARRYAASGIYSVTLIVNDGIDDSLPSTAMVIIGEGEALEFSIPLEVGWNLISLPVKLLDDGLDSALTSIQGQYDSIWTYDAVAGKWSRYIVDGTVSPDGLDKVRSGVGYWIKMNRGGELIIQGTQPVTAVLLETGWNLVGCNSTEPEDIQNCMSHIGGKYRSVWTYDSVQGKWLSYVPDCPPFLKNIELMQPGKGYWIDVKGKCSWSIEP
jgi:hypothetical protein